MTIIDKDCEEKIIKVPVGMSMLEATNENDIELEGNSYMVTLLTRCIFQLTICNCVIAVQFASSSFFQVHFL